MKIHNLWYTGILTLAWLVLLVFPTIPLYVLWFFISIMVAVLTASSDTDLEYKFNITFLSLIISAGIAIYANTKYPYKRDIHQKVYTPKSYAYIGNKLYINVSSPKTMVNLTPKVNNKQLSYMAIHKCKPILVTTTFKFWFDSKTTLHNWMCKGELNDN